MKASDTVMQQVYPVSHEEHLKQLQKQAEISFKTGEQAGIKKVVDTYK